tara:strand:+ start:417 stop:587 length:171 start_codon:yes stop_codon:yes gene_type:complete
MLVHPIWKMVNTKKKKILRITLLIIVIYRIRKKKISKMKNFLETRNCVSLAFLILI